MIISYNKKDKKVSPLTETEFKGYGIMERQDIESWVEDMPEILGEDFYIITTEYDKFDKTDERLDILAIDREGSLSIIELKRASSGKYADLQAIKYASYCSTLTLKQIIEINVEYLSKKGTEISHEEARNKIMNFISNFEFEELDGKPRIILVAAEYTPEVTATVLWLRKFELDISCVKFKPYIFNADTVVFESSIIIPLPEAKDFQIETENRSNNANLNRAQEEYLAFYTKIMENIKDKIKLPLQRHTGKKPYYQIKTNIGGIHFEWGFHGRPRSSFGVEIHFEKGAKIDNEKYYDEIIKLKDELEKSTGETLISEKNWGSRWSRIYIEKKQGNIDDGLIKWGIENMIKFVEIINKKLEELQYSKEWDATPA
jgi:hypothetical protein